ncbi:MAG: nuclear transport factor 2 family protein [Variibacter sp.]|nr:nuclear transport factor 2 family protein [Variibacter sp.]
MRRLLVLLGLWLSLLLTAGPAAAHPPGVADEDQAAAHEVEAFREFVLRTIAKKDVSTLRAIYANSFTHTHGSGKMDGKDTRIVSILAGDPVIETAPAEDVLYRVFGTYTIIVTGRSPILNKAENRTYQFRWMTVYVKVGADWKIAASQATRLP